MSRAAPFPTKNYRKLPEYLPHALRKKAPRKANCNGEKKVLSDDHFPREPFFSVVYSQTGEVTVREKMSYGETKITPDFSIPVDSKLTLRLPRVADAEALFALVEKNRAHLREFLGWLDSSREVANTRSYIEENLPLWLRLQTLHLSILQNETIVGAVGLHQIDSLNRSTSIGYWLDKEREGRGIVTKSVAALIEYGFRELGLHRIEIRCAVHNHRSRRIPEKLGFRKEGEMKEAIYHYNEYLDAYLYGLTAPNA